MKQSEKTKITYEKILNGAIKEFGTKSYDKASINNICSDNNISKGLIYHNFKNKDELYLCCVRECFTKLTDYLNRAKDSSNDFSKNIQQLLDLRYEFFNKNPYFSFIFLETVLKPLPQFVDEIGEIRQDFDMFNLQQYKKIINGIELRDGITEEEALEYFFIFQEMFNGYFGSKKSKKDDSSSLIQDHEIKLSKLLNIMLYGIAKEKKIDDVVNS